MILVVDVRLCEMKLLVSISFSASKPVHVNVSHSLFWNEPFDVGSLVRKLSGIVLKFKCRPSPSNTPKVEMYCLESLHSGKYQEQGLNLD
jgi:hypothetical protein